MSLVFDGPQFFKDFRVRYTTHSPNVSRGWVGIPCPFCGDKSDHLGFHLQTGAMSCWKCGRHSALEYVKTYLRIPASEARTLYTRYLKTVYGITEKQEQKHASEVHLPDPIFTSVEKKYMKSRMLTSYHQTKYDLRGGGITGDWAYRIVIPIYFNNYIVSATGRIIAEDVKPKYKTLSKAESVMNPKHLFLGMDFVVGKQIAIVEGPLDAIRGGPGFVASLGANLTEEQLLLLREYDTIFFIRDSDKAGEQYIEEAYKLSTLCTSEVEVITLDGHKDIGAMPEDEIKTLRGELFGQDS